MFSTNNCAYDAMIALNPCLDPLNVFFGPIFKGPAAEQCVAEASHDTSPRRPYAKDACWGLGSIHLKQAQNKEFCKTMANVDMRR